jgi:hypothetical protein
MDEERELALKLACGVADRYVDPEETVARARLYLDFLTGGSDAKVIDAAKQFGDTLQRVKAGS